MNDQLIIDLKRARQELRTQRPYHPTTPLSREQVIGCFAVARKQEEAVMALFSHLQRPMTASEVWSLCCDAGKKWPLTSVRRAITNLSNDDALVHLHDMSREGIYGKPETFYALPGHQAALPLPKVAGF